MLRRLGRGATAVTLVSLVGVDHTRTAHAHQANGLVPLVAARRARASSGPIPFAHGQPLQLPFWSDMANWSWDQYYSTTHPDANGQPIPRCAWPHSTIQAADIDGDGVAELLARGPGGILVSKFDPSTGQWTQLPNGPELADWEGWNQPQYYSTIQLADVDGDRQAELLARGYSGIVAWHFDKATQQWTAMPDGPGLADPEGWDQPMYYSTIQLADIDGDGQAELLARGYSGIVAWHFDKATQQWTAMPDGPGLADPEGWDQPMYYSTIQLADVDGDGQAELLARGYGGIVGWHFDRASQQWTAMPDGPGLADPEGWDQPIYYSTIQLADIDGDGQAELLARGYGGMVGWRFNKTNQQWSSLPDGPAWSDPNGWDHPQFYLTIQLADIDGDGQAELLARGAGGIVAAHFDKGTQQWSALPWGPPWSDGGSNPWDWDQPWHYMTIQSARIDPSARPRQAYLLGRNSNGMETWKYDPVGQQWRILTAAFPQFSGGQLAAYQAISTALMEGEVNADVRSQYASQSTGVLNDWYTRLTANPDSIPIPLNVSQQDWQLVLGQISTEINQAIGVSGQLDKMDLFITDTFLGDVLTARMVEDILAIPPDSTNTVWLNVLEGVANAVWALGGIEGLAAFGVVAGIAAAALGTAIASMPNGGVSLNYQIALLDEQLRGMFTTALSENSNMRATVMADWGLMNAMATMIYQGIWAWPQDMGQAINASMTQYEVMLWKALLPAQWMVQGASPTSWFFHTGWPKSHYLHTEGCYYWPEVQTSSWSPPEYPSDAAWGYLFDPPPRDYTVSPPTGGLGIPLADILTPVSGDPNHFGQNGWSLPAGDLSC